jgi:heat shock protein HtpX
MRKSWFAVLFSFFGCFVFLFLIVSILYRNNLPVHHKYSNILVEAAHAKHVVGAFFITLMLGIIGYSGYGDWIIKVFTKFREPTILEHEQLDSLASDVVGLVNEKYDTNLTKENCQISICESPILNAFAYGKNKIVVNSAIIEGIPTNETMAVLAHEMGHLYNKDSHIGMTNLWLQLPFILLILLAQKVGFLRKNERNYQSNKSNSSLKGWLIVLLIILLFPLIAALLGGAVFFFISNMILKFVSKRQEKAADIFACKLGQADNLSLFIDRLASISYVQSGLISQYFESHPSPRIRKGYIEEYRRGLVRP